MKKVKQLAAMTMVTLMITAPLAVNASDITNVTDTPSWLGRIGSVIDQYRPLLSQYQPYEGMARSTIDKQTAKGLLAGQVVVPDSVINDMLARQLVGQDKVTAVEVTSQKDGTLKVHLDTPSIGGIDLTGTITSFVVGPKESYVEYKIKGKDLEDHGGLEGWLFSHLSLSLIEKLVGSISVGNLPTTVHGNTVRVDFTNALAQSSVGKNSIAGYKLLDVVQVTKAIPQEGGIAFQTHFTGSKAVRTILETALDL